MGRDGRRMSSDIQKTAVYDPRIIQHRPAFQVAQGALSLTTAPFSAIASTSSQQTFNIQVPSENVFLDRRLLWTNTVSMSMTVSSSNGYLGLSSLAVPGRDFSLCALPMNSLCSTQSATINDTVVTANSQDILTSVLRMTDLKANRRVRTAPTKLDSFLNYDDAFGTVVNALAGYESAAESGDAGNGSFGQLTFLNPTGGVLGNTYVAAGNYTQAYANALYVSVNGVPTSPPQWDPLQAYTANSLVQNAGIIWLAVAAVTGTIPAAGAWTALSAFTAAMPLYFNFSTTEPVCLSPFVFSDEFEWSTGLFGLNNIQLIFNFQASASRLIRTVTRTNRVFASVALATVPFTNSRVACQFLTPNLSVALPPKSVVPFMEFPRYITASATSIAANSTGQVVSNTITLPSIPDMLIIYAKPAAYAQNEGDWFLPLATVADGVTAPVSFNWDNFSGLLSSANAEALFAMSQQNGLQMDWQTWSGISHTASGGYGVPGAAGSRQQGQQIPMVGGPLVLRPAQDITLQSGQSNSCVGNYTLQFSITYKNNTANAVTPQLYVITVNSGFFETIRGSSRVIKGVLSEQDVIAATSQPSHTSAEVNRMIGGTSMKALGNVLKASKAIYDARPAEVRSMDGGASGGRSGGSSGGRSGGAVRHRTLESRLM